MSKESVYDILFKKNNVGEPECNKVEARSDIFNMDNKELYTLAPTISSLAWKFSFGSCDELTLLSISPK